MIGCIRESRDAEIVRMKSGRIHRAHRAEYAVNLETSAVVGITVEDADVDGNTMMMETVITAA